MSVQTDADVAEHALEVKEDPHRIITSPLLGQAHLLMARMYLAPDRSNKPLTRKETADCIRQAGSKNRNVSVTMREMEQAGLLHSSSDPKNKLRIPVVDIKVDVVASRSATPVQTWPELTPALEEKVEDAQGTQPVQSTERFERGMEKAVILPSNTPVVLLGGARTHEALRTVYELSRSLHDGEIFSHELRDALVALGRTSWASVVYKLQKAGFLQCVGGIKKSNKDPSRYVVVYRPYSVQDETEVQIPDPCRANDVVEEPSSETTVAEPPAKAASALRTREELDEEIRELSGQLEAKARENEEWHAELRRRQDHATSIRDQIAQLQASLAEAEASVSAHQLAPVDQSEVPKIKERLACVTAVRDNYDVLVRH